MADFITEHARKEKAAAVRGGLDQLASAASRIVAVTQQLTALRGDVAAGVGGDFEQADLDKLDTLTPKVAALNSAAAAFLAE